ncbi:MAG: nitroreductase [Flavobacteriaceae bacterium]|nr:nitroreductase [Flavobacteriaceae bacterium]
MSTLSKIIKMRRSVFPPQYNGKPIDKTVIEKVLEAANWAPTHAKTEPWRFKVLSGDKKNELGVFLAKKYKETAAKFSEIKFRKIQDNAVHSDWAIVIGMQRDSKERIPEWEEVAAVAMAVQNLWLKATELGVGGYWSSPAVVRYLPEIFPFEEGESCLGVFYLGNYDMPSERTPGAWEEKVNWL